MEDGRYNVLVIMTDHQRGDSIGMVQDGKEVTPYLNQMAAESAVFTRAYTTCPLCVPARSALATGKYPTHNGVIVNDWSGESAGDHKPIHQYLDEAAYDVGYVGVHHIQVKPSLQERVSFGMWETVEEYSHYLKKKGMSFKKDGTIHRKSVMELQEGDYVEAKYSNTHTSTWSHSIEDFRDDYFCKKGEGFLRRERSKPFALFVNLWAPHPPLQVPEPYASMFDPVNLTLPSNVGIPAEKEPANRRKGIAAQLAEGVTEAEWRRVWAAHLGLVNLADDYVGRLLQVLRETGAEDNTIVIFTSDHGEHLGQHRMYQKMEMYEQAIRVPLIIKVPGGRSGVFCHPVSHLDLVPTLLELLQIENRERIDGRSLKEALINGMPLQESPVFCQYSGNPKKGDIRRAVITERYKYIYDPQDREELYDLQEDPLETKNLAEEPAYMGKIRELQQLGEAWAREHQDFVDFASCHGGELQ